MSAVMSTLSMISGGRRAAKQKPPKKSMGRKSGQFSDAGEGRYHSDVCIETRRSTSMQTLDNAGVADNANMAGQLDNLEAKMAKIEVSLSSGGRRRGATGSSKENLAIGKGLTKDLDDLRNALREKDALIQSLKEQLSTTLSISRMSATLSEQNCTSPPTCVLSPDERRKLEERTSAAKHRVVEKRQTIAGIKLALDSLHVTDNIDSRIQQAELEYALGREELELLTLMEQNRALQALLEQADTATRNSHTLYGCVKESGGIVTMNAVEVNMESASPRLCSGGGKPGIRVEWARENSGLVSGDRLIEVDGKAVWSCKNPSELPRVSGTAHMVVMRTAKGTEKENPHPTSAALTQVVTLRAELELLRQHTVDANKVKESLRADNLRLTHRISYLEEQVSELVTKADGFKSRTEEDEKTVKATVNKTTKNVTNISITSDTPPENNAPKKNDVQVFQKGPDITALVANLPGLQAGANNTQETSANLPVLRPKSTMSNVSSIAINSPRPTRSRSIMSGDMIDKSPSKQRPCRQSHEFTLQQSKSAHSLDKDKYESVSPKKSYKMRSSLSQHSIPGKLDYHAETAAALEIIKQNQKHYISPLNKLDLGRSDENFASKIDFYDNTSFSDVYSKGSNDNVAAKKTSWAERKTMSIIEQLKQSQRLRKAKCKNKSIEHIDFESENLDRLDGKVIETNKSTRRLSKPHSRNSKYSDFESENSDYPSGNRNNLDYTSEPNGHMFGSPLKQSQSMMNVLDSRPRPMPPKKPMRLSLHKAQSSHSVNSDRTLPDILDGSTGDIYRYSEDQRKPAKRNHKGDRFPAEQRASEHKEKLNTMYNRSGSATPRPSKKFQDNGYQAFETPGADDLYPDSPKMLTHRSRGDDSQRHYSPKAPSVTESASSRTPSRAESNYSSKWPTTPNRSPNEQQRYAEFYENAKWC